MTVPFIIFMVGLALIIVAVYGGGLEIKEVKIPTLPLVPRIASFVIGCLLIALIFTPILKYLNTPSEPNISKMELGASIKIGIIAVRDVKKLLNHLGYYKGPINDDPDPPYFQAVTDFQIAQKVEADGLVGGQTYQKLKEGWPDYFAVNGGAGDGRPPPSKPTTSLVSDEARDPTFGLNPEMDFNTYKSEKLQVSFVYPLAKLMVDNTHEAEGRLPLHTVKRETEVVVTRTPLPDHDNVRIGRRQEKQALEAMGYSINLRWTCQ
jgi:Putative peptidoglycan binding domain